MPVVRILWRCQMGRWLMVAPDSARSTEEDRDYRTVYDPETVKVAVAILDRQLVLTARDKYRTQAQVLMTVTDLAMPSRMLPCMTVSN